MRILFAGGGTGGHLYPVLSLAQALSGAPADPGACRPDDASGRASPAHGRRDASSDEKPTLLFVGTRGGLEEDLLKHYGLPYAAVSSSPIGRSSVRAAAGGAAKNVRGAAQAVPILRAFKPDVVVATGGYASVPTVFAAAALRSSGVLRGAKIALLEPNAVPGRANRLLARMADEVWGAYEETGAHFGRKFVRTGVPVRPELYALPTREQARARLGLAPDRTTILIFGGSQGARSINVAASGMVARRRLPAAWQIIHLTGERDYEWMRAERKAEANQNRYLLEAYLPDMATAYAAADVAVCRAGASTLAELAAVGLPAILIPYPHAADDHQRANAAVFGRAGAAVTIEDAQLNPDSLFWALTKALEPEQLAAMRAGAKSLSHPNAPQVIVERILGGHIGAGSRARRHTSRARAAAKGRRARET